MSFKKPKSKDVQTVVKGLLAFEGGKRIGRGIVGQINPTSDANAQMIKGGIAIGSIVAAAAYKGKNAEMVVPAFVGLAAEQIGNIVDAQAAEMIEKDPNPGFAEKFVYDVFGLGCSAPQGRLNAVNNRYPMLAQPTLREVEWDTIYTGDDAAVYSGGGDFAGA